MRKTLLVITVLLVATQAYAGTVTLSVDDEGGGWAAIRYSSVDANVSGFGLKVTADSGASFTAIDDYNVGECTASVQGFGIFPGTIDVNALTGVVDNNGLPVAPNDAPGASGTGFSTGTLVLEMGALYVEGNEPALSGTLILVQVDGDSNVCVETEPIRGNVVLTDANEASVVYSPNCVSVSGGAVDCYTGPEPSEWANVVGKPDCWCASVNPRQCYGDADGLSELPGKGDYWVYTADLGIMMSAWAKTFAQIDGQTFNGVPLICADFDHNLELPGKGDYRVYTADLSIMMGNWATNAVDPNCP